MTFLSSRRAVKEINPNFNEEKVLEISRDTIGHKDTALKHKQSVQVCLLFVFSNVTSLLFAFKINTC